MSRPGDRLTLMTSPEPQRPSSLPLARLRAGRAQDERVDLLDQPEFLGQRHEQPRVDQTADRVRPAHERLEANDAARVEVVDRLVVREEITVVDGGAQIALLLNARQHRGVHLLPVDLEAVLAALLRLVHGDVRVAQQLLAGDSRFVERDADAAG